MWRGIGKGWFVEEESLLSYKALALNHDPSKALRLNGNGKHIESIKNITEEVIAKTATAHVALQTQEILCVEAEPSIPVEAVVGVPVKDEIYLESNVEIISPKPTPLVPFEKVAWKVSRAVAANQASASFIQVLGHSFIHKVGAVVLSTYVPKTNTTEKTTAPTL